jgi:hypothetical protein
MPNNNDSIIIRPSGSQETIPLNEVSISTDEAARQILSADSWMRFEERKNWSRLIVIMTMLLCATAIIIVMLLLKRPVAEIVAISTSMPAALGLLTHLASSQVISRKTMKGQNPDA